MHLIPMACHLNYEFLKILQPMFRITETMNLLQHYLPLVQLSAIMSKNWRNRWKPSKPFAMYRFLNDYVDMERPKYLFNCRKNFLHIDVYFADLKYESVTQTKGYGIIEFLSKYLIRVNFD